MPAFRSYGGFPYTRACDGVGHTRVMVSGNSLSYARDGVTKFIPYAYDGGTHTPMMVSNYSHIRARDGVTHCSFCPLTAP